MTDFSKLSTEDLLSTLSTEELLAMREKMRAGKPKARKGDASASFLQGATFGFGDELVAAGSAGLRTIYDPRTGQVMSGDFGGKYEQDLAEQRLGRDAEKLEHGAGSRRGRRAGRGAPPACSVSPS